MCLLGGKSGYGGKGYYMRRGKSYYKKGETWLYSRISPGEKLLYSQFSGGKATIIASFPGGNLARGKGYYTIPVLNYAQQKQYMRPGFPFHHVHVAIMDEKVNITLHKIDILLHM